MGRARPFVFGAGLRGWDRLISENDDFELPASASLLAMIFILTR